MLKKMMLSLLLSMPLFCAKYLTNKSCNECHPDIYEEYQHSYHAKTWFNDTLHRKVAQKIPVYDCGRCHMPAAKNLAAMEKGEMLPNPIHQEQKDAVSCFYCHQIAYVKKAHKFDEIVLAKQADGYKPSLYGSLKDPDDSDKHAMVHSPIYDKYVCMGCHSHKRNNQDVLIFKAMDDSQDSKECIKCHMPYIGGPVEKMNKRARNRHRSHYFAGIHDAHMREQSIDISLHPEGDKIVVELENRMPHPLVVHPSRMKYLGLKVIRNGKVIWRNFEKDPTEDKQGSFYTEFEDGKGRIVGIPYYAEKVAYSNNLGPKEKKELVYKVPSLRKNDKIVAEMYVVLAKPSCAAAAGIEDESLTRPIPMKKVETIVK